MLSKVARNHGIAGKSVRRKRRKYPPAASTLKHVINRIEMRLVRETPQRNLSSITRPEEAYSLFRWMEDSLQEEVVAAYLDTRHRLIGFYQVAKGSQTGAIVLTADILRPALLCGATSIILAHNHPSGDPTPSAQDRLLTKQIFDACKTIGIELLDHLVIGDRCFESLMEMGAF